MSLLVLTIVGPDRPGLVEKIADTVATHEGNWMESRMAHLGGKFAGILQVDVPDNQTIALQAELDSLAKDGLHVHVEEDISAPEEKLISVTLELVGGDRPGIVKEIAHVLANRQVNVEELITDCVAAPMTGKDLFRATAKLQLPPGVDLEQLQHHLEEVAGDLMVDISLNTSQSE